MSSEASSGDVVMLQGEDGEAMADAYRRLAAEHMRQAKADDKTRRPIRAAKHRAAATVLKHAADFEETNPDPPGVGETKLLPPPPPEEGETKPVPPPPPEENDGA